MDKLLKLHPNDYEERVYAGWLGKCIGVHLGGPVEGWSYKKIRENIGEIKGYIQTGDKIYKPDDDLIMPLIMMSVLEGKNSPIEITSEDIGDTWRNLLSKERGGIWRGGYGISSEHTALLNLHHGVPAPLSGSQLVNGKTVAEQIGGQIFSDIWGLVLPNDPLGAADLAQKASRVSHDGEGVFGGRFIAAMVSLAFNGKTPLNNLPQVLEVLPEESTYSHMIGDLIRFHAENPNEWRAAREYVEEHWGYQHFSGAVPIIPNAAVIVLALLYGEEDFSKTLQIACMSGWDTDCNVGNVGAIMGVTVGLAGIDHRWREPLKDYIVSSSIRGSENICDIPNTAIFLANCGKRFAGIAAGASRPRYSFHFPGSIQGFDTATERCRFLSVQQTPEVEAEDPGALKIVLHRLDAKGVANVFVRTHLSVDELSSNAYEACFSPSLYPGQRVSARVYLQSQSGPDVHAAIYVKDRLKGFSYQESGVRLKKDEWIDLHLAIPRLEGVCLSEVGIAINNWREETWNGSLLLKSLDWSGIPDYGILLGSLPMNGKTPLGWTTYSGNWFTEEGGLSGSGYEDNEAYTGNRKWDNYELAVKFIPIHGERHCINFRVQGGLASYAFGFLEKSRLGILKKINGKYQVLASEEYNWEHGREYILRARVAKNVFLLSVEDDREISYTDEDSPYLSGQIGLSNGPACRTGYVSLQVSPIPVPKVVE